jgi:hypothetical protein
MGVVFQAHLDFLFVSLSGFRREKAIKDLLARCASELDEWMIRGIVGSLKIPMAWVHEAKVGFCVFSKSLVSLLLIKCFFLGLLCAGSRGYL